MKIKFTINSLLSTVALLLLTSCGGGPALDARAAYTSCGYQYDSIIKVSVCAKDKMRTFEQQYGAGTVYNRGTETLKFYEGLVYKVKSNQISNDDALNRFSSFTQQKAAADKRRSQENARKIGDTADGLNCLWFGVNC
jgi:hypothetical protein